MRKIRCRGYHLVEQFISHIFRTWLSVRPSDSHSAHFSRFCSFRNSTNMVECYIAQCLSNDLHRRSRMSNPGWNSLSLSLSLSAPNLSHFEDPPSVKKCKPFVESQLMPVCLRSKGKIRNWSLSSCRISTLSVCPSKRPDVELSSRRRYWLSNVEWRTSYLDMILSLEPVGRTNVRQSNIRPTVYKKGQM